MKRLPTNLLILNAFLLASPLVFAQTSPLDSAPGAATAPAVTPGAAPATPPASAPTPSAAPAPDTDSGPSLLSNPDFSQATKDPSWPDDWGKAAGITYETENGIHFLRLVQQTPGKMLMAYREMAIPAGTAGIKITIRYRTAGIVHGKQNYMDARGIFHFLDGARQQVKPEPKVIQFSNNASDWTVGSTSALVPPGATTLQLMPALFMVNAGTLDFAEIKVTALSDAQADALKNATAAQEKKKADRDAYLAAQLALPPISKPLHVSGNQILDPDGKSVWLQGVNVPELSWSPNGEDKVVWSVHLAIDDWHANVIRLPVMDSLWFGKGRGDMTSNDADAYRKIVDDAVKFASVRGAYIVLDLHRFFTPDQSCVDFWKDAAARYANNPAVLFDIFNEPHDTSWDVWRNGGQVTTKNKSGTLEVTGVGMQALVNAVRGTGAKNIIVAGGLEYAYNLTGIVNGYALDDKGGDGIVYATHFYNWHHGWSAHFMAVAAKYPVLVGETGADVKKMNFIPLDQQESPATWVPDAIGFIQKNHLNWTAWSFAKGATPDMLIDTTDFAPNPFWGEPVKEALSGKQFEMQKER